MAELLSIFDRSVAYEPGGDFEAFLKQVPARWVVYLFTDEHDQPVQLLCVKNLRYSLKRRLGGEEMVGVSKRVNYRQLVRRVYWRRVDSAFEADWVYLEAARQLFPTSYQGMVGFRPAWFVQVNPEAKFPRYIKTTDLSSKAGVLIGPVEDKHAAQRLIALAEDCFDLCRYYNILVAAPQGKACAYKEMGRCPAPCDGSISMEQYRQMVALSVRTMVQPGEFVQEQTRQMQEAAAGLQFEVAGKIKARIEQAGQFGHGAYRHARRLEDFAFLMLQRGPKAGRVKVFLVVRGTIEEVAGLIGEAGGIEDLLECIRARAGECAKEELTAAGVERIGLVAAHLLSGKQSQGVFLQLDEVDEKAVMKGYRELGKHKEEEEVEGEGVIKELQASEGPMSKS
ncbi:MAG: hypothetical protein ACM359_25080 [Bacillota bacterium]